MKHKKNSYHDSTPANHGGGKFGPMDIGRETSDAHVETWHDPKYAMEQYHNGSMNYLQEKDHIASADYTKVRRTQIPEILR